MTIKAHDAVGEEILWVSDGIACPEFGDNSQTYTIKLKKGGVQKQFVVLMSALAIYAERNEEYKDNWERMGWRGALVRVRERAERLWDSLWDASPGETDCDPPEETIKKLDDAYDGINFLGFLIRGVEDSNRDGTWWSRKR